MLVVCGNGLGHVVNMLSDNVVWALLDLFDDGVEDTAGEFGGQGAAG